MMYCQDVEPNAEHHVIRSAHGIDFIRSPCKARAVQVVPGQHPHVAKYAYIDIPINSQHGATLHCSHPTCYSSGRRFRWCEVCEMAVAKRNFNKRHSHGRSSLPRGRAAAQVEEEDASSMSSNSIEVEEHAIVPTNVSVQEPAPTTFQPQPNRVHSNQHQQHIVHQQVPYHTQSSSEPLMIPVSLRSEEAEIIRFLRSRPSNPEQLRAWKEDLVNMVLSSHKPQHHRTIHHQSHHHQQQPQHHTQPPQRRITDQHHTQPPQRRNTDQRHVYNLSIDSFPCDESYGAHVEEV